MSILLLIPPLLGLLLGPPVTRAAPFAVALAPESYRDATPHISMGAGNNRAFFVVLTNVTDQGQAVWEDWNSWGYRCVSFQVTTPDGTKHSVIRKPHGFTRNFPGSSL